MKLVRKILFILSAFLFSLIAVTFIVNEVLIGKLSFNIKTVGSTDSWVQYYGSIIGSCIGGVIGGYIALIIANRQINENRKQMESERLELIRKELQLKASETLLEVLNSLDLTLNRDGIYLNRLILTYMRIYNFYSKNSGDIEFVKQLNEDYLKFSRLRELNIEKLYSFQESYIKLTLGKSLIFYDFLSEINSISLKYLTLNRVIKNMEGILTKKDFMNKNESDKLIEFYNGYMDLTKDFLIFTRNFTVAIQNEFLSFLFYNRKIEPDKFPDHYQYISWNDVKDN